VTEMTGADAQAVLAHTFQDDFVCRVLERTLDAVTASACSEMRVRFVILQLQLYLEPRPATLFLCRLRHGVSRDS